MIRKADDDGEGMRIFSRNPSLETGCRRQKRPRKGIQNNLWSASLHLSAPTEATQDHWKIRCHESRLRGTVKIFELAGQEHLFRLSGCGASDCRWRRLRRHSKTQVVGAALDDRTQNVQRVPAEPLPDEVNHRPHSFRHHTSAAPTRRPMWSAQPLHIEDGGFACFGRTGAQKLLRAC